jgi:hypothetical protein
MNKIENNRIINSAGRASKELYKEEVKELTELLRTEWKDIQEIVMNLNLDVSKTYLLGFVASEDETESGLIYTEKKSLIRFEKKLNNLDIKIVTKECIENDFPQVTVVDEIEDFGNW